MPIISNITRWLQGSFKCIKCGNTFQTYNFGYGECICPNCYHGEHQFLFFDHNFILNRLSSRLYNKTKTSIEQNIPTENDVTILDEVLLESEFREYNIH